MYKKNYNNLLAKGNLFAHKKKELNIPIKFP